jgi:hypothetical protein
VVACLQRSNSEESEHWDLKLELQAKSSLEFGSPQVHREHDTSQDYEKIMQVMQLRIHWQGTGPSH